MTESPNEKKKSTVLTRGQLLFCVMSIAALALTFIYSDVAISSMASGMKLCVTTVIPALFPFMVFSELFVSSGGARFVGKLVGYPFCKLFGISREGSSAVILGFLCGFPIGAKSASSLYEGGRISREELEHICSFCNNPSSAFLISAVGASLFGSQFFGILLYLSHILSSLTVGVLGRPYFYSRKNVRYCKKAQECEIKHSIFGDTVKAITSSAQNMLFICAFVVFFSALTGYIRLSFSLLQLPEALRALAIGFFEMTGGAAEVASLPEEWAIPAVAAITGWAGLSVHFQFIGICSEHKLSFAPYFICKVANALLNAVYISLLSIAFSKYLKLELNGSVPSLLSKDICLPSVLIFSFFGLACLALFLKSRKKR